MTRIDIGYSLALVVVCREKNCASASPVFAFTRTPASSALSLDAVGVCADATLHTSSAAITPTKTLRRFSIRGSVARVET